MKTYYMPVVVSMIIIASMAILDLSNFSTVQAVPAIKNVQIFTNVSNPSISVDPLTGIVYGAFARTENNLTNVYLISSSDEGITFSEPARVNNIDGDASTLWNTIPVRFGSAGEIYVVWMSLKDHPDFPYGVTELRTATSLDGGKTFSAAINPVPGAPSERAFFDLTVSKEGALYLSYLDSATNEGNKTDELTKIIGYPSSYKLTKSTDGGKSFNKPVTLDEQNCVCCQTASVMGPDGEVYFGWRDLQYKSEVRDFRSDNPYNYGNSNGSMLEDFDPSVKESIRDIVVKHTTDGAIGNTFTNESKVSNDRWYMDGCPDAGPGMAFDSTGRLHVVWFTGSETAPAGLGYYYAYSDDKGETFSKSIPILTDEEFIPPAMASLSVDSSDNIWVAFADQRSPAVVRYSEIEEGHPGSLHLAVIDKKQTILYNDSIARGAIHEFVDISSYGNSSFIAWKDGVDSKFAAIRLGK